MAVNWLMSNDKKDFKRLTFQESFLDRLQTKLKHKLEETGFKLHDLYISKPPSWSVRFTNLCTICYNMLISI